MEPTESHENLASSRRSDTSEVQADQTRSRQTVMTSFHEYVVEQSEMQNTQTRESRQLGQVTEDEGMFNSENFRENLQKWRALESVHTMKKSSRFTKEKESVYTEISTRVEETYSVETVSINPSENVNIKQNKTTIEETNNMFTENDTQDGKQHERQKEEAHDVIQEVMQEVFPEGIQTDTEQEAQNYKMENDIELENETNAETLQLQEPIFESADSENKSEMDSNTSIEFQIKDNEDIISCWPFCGVSRAARVKGGKNKNKKKGQNQDESDAEENFDTDKALHELFMSDDEDDDDLLSGVQGNKEKQNEASLIAQDKREETQLQSEQDSTDKKKKGSKKKDETKEEKKMRKLAEKEEKEKKKQEKKQEKEMKKQAKKEEKERKKQEKKEEKARKKQEKADKKKKGKGEQIVDEPLEKISLDPNNMHYQEEPMEEDSQKFYATVELEPNVDMLYVERKITDSPNLQKNPLEESTEGEYDSLPPLEKSSENDIQSASIMEQPSFTEPTVVDSEMQPAIQIDETTSEQGILPSTEQPVIETETQEVTAVKPEKKRRFFWPFSRKSKKTKVETDEEIKEKPEKKKKEKKVKKKKKKKKKGKDAELEENADVQKEGEMNEEISKEKEMEGEEDGDIGVSQNIQEPMDVRNEADEFNKPQPSSYEDVKKINGDAPTEEVSDHVEDQIVEPSNDVDIPRVDSETSVKITKCCGFVRSKKLKKKSLESAPTEKPEEMDTGTVIHPMEEIENIQDENYQGLQTLTLQKDEYTINTSEKDFYSPEDVLNLPFVDSSSVDTLCTEEPMPPLEKDWSGWINSEFPMPHHFIKDVGKTKRLKRYLELRPEDKFDMRLVLEKGGAQVLETKEEEAARLKRERAQSEMFRKQREIKEKQRLEEYRMEMKRIEQEKKERDARLEIARKARMAQERIEREKETQERLAKLEERRLERERLTKERLEKERIEKEKAEQEKLERKRLEKEKLEKEKLEKERLEKEKLEKEKLEKEKAEQETQLEESLLQKETKSSVSSSKPKGVKFTASNESIVQEENITKQRSKESLGGSVESSNDKEIPLYKLYRTASITAKRKSTLSKRLTNSNPSLNTEDTANEGFLIKKYIAPLYVGSLENMEDINKKVDNGIFTRTESDPTISPNQNVKNTETSEQELSTNREPSILSSSLESIASSSVDPVLSTSLEITKEKSTRFIIPENKEEEAEEEEEADDETTDTNEPLENPGPSFTTVNPNISEADEEEDEDVEEAADMISAFDNPYGYPKTLSFPSRFDKGHAYINKKMIRNSLKLVRSKYGKKLSDNPGFNPFEEDDSSENMIMPHKKLTPFSQFCKTSIIEEEEEEEEEEDIREEPIKQRTVVFEEQEFDKSLKEENKLVVKSKKMVTFRSTIHRRDLGEKYENLENLEFVTSGFNEMNFDISRILERKINWNEDQFIKQFLFQMQENENYICKEFYANKDLNDTLTNQIGIIVGLLFTLSCIWKIYNTCFKYFLKMKNQ